jgi:hypothetical protein
MSDLLPPPENWLELETALSRVPAPLAARFASRCAARLLPAVAKLAEDYGPEVQEWSHAIAEVIRVVEAYSRGERLSRFTRDLAVEAARATANATANTARLMGQSAYMEQAELAYAAAAYAADATRASSAERAASFAARAAQMESPGAVPTADQIADLQAIQQSQSLTEIRPLPERSLPFRLLE